MHTPQAPLILTFFLCWGGGRQARNELPPLPPPLSSGWRPVPSATADTGWMQVPSDSPLNLPSSPPVNADIG
jgi:hypothetical protein